MNQKSILIVESATAIYEGLPNKVRDLGYIVQTLYSGEASVKYISDGHSVDLILMALHLGEGIDGREAAEKILKIKKIPIVFMSAMLNPKIIEELRGVPRYGYLVNNSGDSHIQASIEMALELFETQEKLQNNLAESYGQIRTISNNLPEGMIYQVIRNKDGSRKFTFLSDTVKKFYGISPSDGYLDANQIYSRVHEDDTERVWREEEEAHIAHSVFRTEVRMVSPDGSLRWSYFVSTPKKLEDGITCWDGIEFDITKRKLSEETINSLLKEKELLLKEVHHRIKNNMNVISSLLELQANYIKNPEASLALHDTKARVRSMALLYDKLYRTTDCREISVREHILNLITEISQIYPKTPDFSIEEKVEDFQLNAKLMMPLGIILNELLTNGFKHAFKNRTEGKISISITKKENQVILSVWDNGIGMAENTNPEKPAGFGLMLTNLLAKNIHGTFRIEKENGTNCILEFKI